MNLWNDINKLLLEAVPKIGQSFNSAATISEIELLETTIDIKLPTSFVDYLQTYNGQAHNNYEIPFVGYNCMLSVQQILEEWKMLNHLFRDEPPIDFIKENKISPKIWDKGWIPFACFEADARLILDMNPGKNGCEGQILQMWGGQDFESEDVVIANSFEEFSHRVLENLSAQAFEIEDGVIILNGEWLV